MAMREKDQEDFDMERFIDMFDTAMTSDDPRIKNALRQLMMIVILTEPEDKNTGLTHRNGPLRRLYEDVRNLNTRLTNLDDQFHRLETFTRAAASSFSHTEGTRPKYPEQWGPQLGTLEKLAQKIPDVRAKTAMDTALEKSAIPGAQTLWHGHK